MFICLRPCFDKECETLNDKCLVCDTSDLTFEYISNEDVADYYDPESETLAGQPVAIDNNNRYGFQYLCTFETALQNIRRVSYFASCVDSISRFDVHNWNVAGATLSFTSELTHFIINDIRVDRHNDVYKQYVQGYALNYAFRFREYIIFRICYNTLDIITLVDTVVLSVAVKHKTNEVACIWDDVHGVLYEKVQGLAIKVDTLCNY